LLIGGLATIGFIGGIAIYRATARPPAPKCIIDIDCPAGYVCKNGACVPAPPGPKCSVDSDCPAGYVCKNGACVEQGTGLPALVTTLSYSPSISQNLGFYETGTVGKICVENCIPYLSLQPDDKTVQVQGYSAYDAYFSVRDVAGHGVPNVPLLAYPLSSRDAEGGILYINGRESTSLSPARVVTDSKGTARLWFEYHETLDTVKLLFGRHKLSCCMYPWGTVGSLDYPGCCGRYLGVYATYPCYQARTASSDLQLYTVHVEIEGAPLKATEITFTSKFNSKCLW